MISSVVDFKTGRLVTVQLWEGHLRTDIKMEQGGVVGELREAAWRKTLSREEMEWDVNWDMNGSKRL